MLFILDNGHGFDTPGKRSPVWKDGTQLFEYEFNRDIVKRIAKKLGDAGIAYRILVPEENDISLAERCRRANLISGRTKGECVLFSIHANAGGGTGFEVYTTKGETRADPLATILFEEMEKEFPDKKMRADYCDGDPDKESQFYILRHTQCPAMLSENFFFDNEKDCKELFKSEFRERIADAHVRAIMRMCNFKK